MNANMEYFNRVVEAVKNNEYFYDEIAEMKNGEPDISLLFYLTVNTTEPHPSFYIHETLGGEIMWNRVEFDPFNQEFYQEIDLEVDGEVRSVRIPYSGTEVVDKIVESMREYAE